MGKRVTVEKIGVWINEFLLKSCGLDVGARVYRQLYVEICRVFVGSELDTFLEGEDVEDDVGIAQQSHSVSTADAHYGVEYGQLPGVTSQRMLRFGRMSRIFCGVWGGVEGHSARQPLQTRQNIIQGVSSAILDCTEGKRTLSEGAIINIVSETISDQYQQWNNMLEMKMKKIMVDSLMDLGLGNGGRADTRPSHSTVSGFRPTETSEDSIMNSSSSPQQGIETLTSFDEEVGGSASLERFVTPSVSLQKSVVPVTSLEKAGQGSLCNSAGMQLCSDGVLVTLLQKHFIHINNPTFKSGLQMQMVRMAVERKKSFVTVMSTGSGKSLCWLLPAWLDDNMITFIVVPHTSLLDNHIRTAQGCNIPSFHWTVETPDVPIGIRLIFVALESAVSARFQRFLRENEQRIARAVLDEGHEVLTMKFRKDFEKIHILGSYNCQRIIMTATLPPRFEKKLLDLLRLPVDTAIIRGNSDQPTIGYHLLRFDATQITVENVRDVVSVLRERCLTGTDIGIIFCSNIGTVDLLAEKLDCCTRSHSRLDTEEKLRNERDWLSGRKQWIAATTGMIQGINCTRVRAVIYHEDVYGVVNIVQAGGRTSRDGRPGYGIFLNAKHKPLSAVQDPVFDFEGRGDAKIWVKSSECRRLVFSRLLDKRKMGCGDMDGSNPCDFCAPDNGLTKALQALTHKRPTPIANSGSEDRFEVVNDTTWNNDGRNLTNVPGSNAPSAGIMRERLQYESAQRTLKDKAAIMERATSDILGNCPVCWALHGGMHKARHRPYSKYFRECLGMKYVEQAGGWIYAKKKIRFRQEHGWHCWTCGIPQGEHRPTAHGDKTGSSNCVMEDWVILLAWTVMIVPDLWEDARNDFPDLPQLDLGPDRIGEWCMGLRGRDYFYNGLEVAIWLCSRVLDDKK
ncbi:hypothetical protein M422DRAFT_53228 [Sphaerobolus stellatus SS14]|uniref:DNA 3'-5' helicase n=1 Tax=Sphaerobolus stellatus (strain SS14) TaxID=990650 RepID=A0A0C9V2K0_SPHS4|nr:hypothetical protein M422DRAFT_53228 [Sphaerobolus stellatus SS14]